MMHAKRQRLRFLLASLVLMGLAAFAILRSFSDSLVFFYTPTEWQEKHAGQKLEDGREVRIGGLVKTGSVRNLDGGVVFSITDLTHTMKVTYHGLLPTLFREGQGVVAQGTIDDKGEMTASSILAKHDENYMPREVVEQLKASGRWQEYNNNSNNSASPIEAKPGKIKKPKKEKK